MKRSILIIIITASVNAWANMSIRCENELVMNAPTKRLASYLGALVERLAIGDKELLTFIEGLDQKKIVNPIAESDASIQSALLIHRQKIATFLNAPDLELALLRDWAYSALKEKNRVKEKRAETAEETSSLLTKFRLEKVPGGVFTRNVYSNAPSRVTLDAFEVMNTLVTQKMWVEVMGENPSHFKTGDSMIIYTKQGKQTPMLPDNPVENITIWSAMVFANRLSELYDLAPFYDLSKLVYGDGIDIEVEAANGTLVPKQGTVSVNFTSGGFQLPASNHINYLLRDLGTQNQDFFADKDPVKLKKYAWHSEQSTQPVGKLFPITIETPHGPIDLFDLQGNVSIWEMSFNTNEASWMQRIHGGSWFDKPWIFFENPATTQNPEHRSPRIGIRLIRRLPR